MTIRTRAQLNADADTYINDNTTGDVTAADVRQRVKDLADSAAFLTEIREKLTANRTIYVSTSGNDSTGDGTSGAPFATIQRAVNVVAAIDMAGFTATISVGAGTYNEAVQLKSLVGGFCVIVGDESTPSNVIINASGSCFTGDGLVGAWHLRGMKLQATTHGIGVTDGAIVKFQNIDFGVCSFYHMLATGGRLVATGNYSITGSASRHVYLFAGASFQCQARTVTLSGSLAFAVFLQATTASTATVSGNTYSGSATGQRHNAQMNAVIQSAGGGANYFPGDAAGAVATGGQYG
ncbi:DUF1565 domain-containing protein [Mesorhizobium sp. YM1C-6-2]|uniref:DUF1565 domain-containing protein n=1 Tax=Mesorhizobium sp. YM1C-6-2 TaxID=1827501 RepID=UPI000EF1D7D3|nr:DUF1565 domain-containing protein [Mesorhizobium sp. YM1C-6-2]RLP21987.1 hypothetical protein D8676_26500 [Mesorhizobium sp. YM1C-6-2]